MPRLRNASHQLAIGGCSDWEPTTAIIIAANATSNSSTTVGDDDHSYDLRSYGA